MCTIRLWTRRINFPRYPIHVDLMVLNGYSTARKSKRTPLKSIWTTFVSLEIDLKDLCFSWNRFERPLFPLKSIWTTFVSLLFSKILKLCPLSFFFWSLCSLPFVDVRILITPFVSSNSSWTFLTLHNKHGGLRTLSVKK